MNSVGSEPQYWLVGATWGAEDKRGLFLSRGYWELGWSKDDQPKMAALLVGIKPGDRIAIKSRLGQGSSEIAIRDLGIVKDVSLDDNRVFVDWIVTNLHREVPSLGCYQAIRGPFTMAEHGPWIGQAFRL